MTWNPVYEGAGSNEGQARKRVYRSYRVDYERDEDGWWVAPVPDLPRELPVGPPLKHKVAREGFLAQAKLAGLELVDEPTFLPYQYFLVLKPRR